MTIMNNRIGKDIYRVATIFINEYNRAPNVVEVHPELLMDLRDEESIITNHNEGITVHYLPFGVEVEVDSSLPYNQVVAVGQEHNLRITMELQL